MQLEPRDEVDQQLNQYLAEQAVQHDNLHEVVNETEKFHQNQCSIRFAQAIEQSKAEIAEAEQHLTQSQNRICALQEQLRTIPSNLMSYEKIENTGVGKKPTLLLQAASLIALTILALAEIQLVPNVMENAGVGSAGMAMLIFGLLGFAVTTIKAVNVIFQDKEIDVENTAKSLKMWLMIHMICLCSLFIRPSVEIQSLLTELFPSITEAVMLLGTVLEIGLNLVWVLSMVWLVQSAYLMAAAGLLSLRKHNRLIHNTQNPAFIQMNHLISDELALISEWTNQKLKAEACISEFKAASENITLAAKTDLIHRTELLKRQSKLQSQLDGSDETTTQIPPLTLVR